MTLFEIPRNLQTSFPNLVESNIEQALHDNGPPCFGDGFFTSDELLQKIAPEFWSSRKVVKAWFSQNYPYSEIHHSAYKGDKDLLMELVKLADDDVRPWRIDIDDDTFRSLGGPLCIDEKFMLQAVEVRPSLYWCADASLQRTFSIALAAFGTARNHSPNHHFANCTLGDGYDFRFLAREFVGCTFPTSCH